MTGDSGKPALSARPTVLVIGFGNPGRLDDGLGPALAGEIENWALPYVTVEANYQLNVEDAWSIARHDVVVFADAAVKGSEPFYFRQVAPLAHSSFSSHTVAPEALLAMAHDLFDASTSGYLLGIRGYEFNEFGERLSERAATNLKSAGEHMRLVLEKLDFSPVGSDV